MERREGRREGKIRMRTHLTGQNNSIPIHTTPHRALDPWCGTIHKKFWKILEIPEPFPKEAGENFSKDIWLRVGHRCYNPHRKSSLRADKFGAHREGGGEKWEDGWEGMSGEEGE
jgi:hypothetical protein